MAKKDAQKRLTIPFDLWELAKFFEFDRHNFGIFILEDSRIIITTIDFGEKNRLACLGKITFDEKHRFLLPKNVDTYLGEGDNYYFTVELLESPNNRTIFLNKINKDLQKLKQDYHARKLLEYLEGN